MANELRTRINELPVCEDVELLDTLLGLGTDGKTYRVNKDVLGSGSGGGATWTSLPFNRVDFTMSEDGEDSSILRVTDLNAFKSCYDLGGRLHVVMHKYDDWTEYNQVVDVTCFIGSIITSKMTANSSGNYLFHAYGTIQKTQTDSMGDDGEQELVSVQISYEPGARANITVKTMVRNESETGVISYNPTAGIVNGIVIDGIYFEPVAF